MRTSVFRNLNADFFPICLTVPNTRYSFLICVEKHRMLYLFFPISCFRAPCFVSCFLAWITRLEKAGSAEMSPDPCSLFSGFSVLLVDEVEPKWNRCGTGDKSSIKIRKQDAEARNRISRVRKAFDSTFRETFPYFPHQLDTLFTVRE